MGNSSKRSIISLEICMRSKSLLCILLNIFSFASVFGQKYPVSLDSIQKNFNTNDLYILTNNESIQIDVKGDELEINDRTFVERYFLTNKASYLVSDKISFVEFNSKLISKSACMLTPKGNGKFKKEKVTDFVTNNNTSESVFYDDVTTLSFNYPNPMKGAIGQLDYTVKILDPHFMPRFYFSTGNAGLSSEFVIKVSNKVKLNATVINATNDIVATKVTKGDYTIYTWKMLNIPAVESESNAQSLGYSLPHVLINIESYQGKTKNVEVIKNTKGLFDYCYSLLERGIEKDNADIQRLADSIVGGSTNKVEKLRKIYDFVQEKINYIAIENGLGGFIPREPSLVLKRRYGDCKDIANLLCALLNAVQVTTYHTWIGTDKLPYKFDETPMMGVANHMIAASLIDTNWYFLDGTSKFLSYQYPSSFIQGKQAMIAVSKDEFLLKVVPIVPSEVNYTKTDFKLRISGDTLYGMVNQKMDGLVRCDFSIIPYYVAQNRLQEVYESELEINHNNCKFRNINIRGMKGRDSLLSIDYEFKIPYYSLQIEDKLLVNLNLKRPFATDLIENNTSRNRNVKFDNTLLLDYTYTLTIPPNYELVEIPQNTKFINEKFGYECNYSLNNRILTYHQSFYVKSIILVKSDFGDWNDMIKQINKTYKQSILLKSKYPSK